MSDVHKSIWDFDDAERVADELSRTARRLHEMADDAEAGRNDVRIDPSGFHALAYYMESWSLSIDRTCHLDLTDVETHGNAKVRTYECSECGRTCEEIYGKYERCPHCGARVVRDDD